MISLPEKVQKVFAMNFCAVVTDKDNLFIWGEFNYKIKEPYNPFS